MCAFRALRLFNVELTVPYMHDGSVATLEEVLDNYAADGRHIENGLYARVGWKPRTGRFSMACRLARLR